VDRRDALRRLVAGGVTVAGTTAVLSQPAFAFTDPALLTGSPTVTVATTGQNSSTALISIGGAPGATCPASALSATGPNQASLNWTTFWPGGNQQMSGGSGNAVSIDPGTYDRWYTDDQVLVTVVYKYQCVYASQTVELCVSWFRQFSATVNGGRFTTWTLQGIESTGPTVVACSSGAGIQLKSAPSTWYNPSGRTTDGPLR
jgi:hypothetical protein